MRRSEDGQTITLTIQLRGTLPKYFGGERERLVEVPGGLSAGDALIAAGLDWVQIPNFGFVAVNGMRVMIGDPVFDGDVLKAYSKVSGG